MIGNKKQLFIVQLLIKDMLLHVEIKINRRRMIGLINTVEVQLTNVNK